jgi:chromate transporter
MAFICIFFFNLPFPLIILGAIVIATLSKQLFPNAFKISNSSFDESTDKESEYYLNKNTIIPMTGFRPYSFWKKVLISIVLWGIPFFLFNIITNDFPFWKNLSLFFTQAALVTFGGAYAVLPYVAQVSVEKMNWLTNLQMMDGLALGETTPGPLIIVLAFVGFMGGYNHFGSSICMGTLALFTTTFYTFLPSFLFILAGAPIIERTQGNKTVKQILSIVSAAVVGVILNLTIYLGRVVVFPKTLTFSAIDLISLLWILISLFVLYRYKLNIILWIGISAVFGLLRFIAHV